MNVNGKHHRSIWLSDDGWSAEVIDQRILPHQFEFLKLRNLEEAAHAIQDMVVRGAPLIGATAAYGIALVMREDASDAALNSAYKTLFATRPTAVNLRWALDDMKARLTPLPESERAADAYRRAAEICDEDVEICRSIGNHGLQLIRKLWDEKKADAMVAGQLQPETFNLLTHCNAGWIATVDYGTALAPIYLAHDAGIPVHVWVDETRPRNQGASLTCWELGEHGVPHTLLVDNAGGHVMQHGLVDMCIVGTDRTTASGDVCNKIGTYLKALAAQDNDVPFYVALPSTTIDWAVADGVAEIPIEKRADREITHVRGRNQAGEVTEVLICPEGTKAGNFAFDVTPARLVTGLITERGVADASPAGLSRLFPEKVAA